MKTLYSLAISLFLFVNSFAQNVTEKVYSDTSLADHQFLDMVLNANGSMVFCGAMVTNDSLPRHRAFLMKLNADYSMAWCKTYERPDPYSYFYFQDIVSINDGGYLVTYLKGGTNFGIMKLDSLGNFQYDRQLIDTVQNSQIRLYDYLQISDSTFLLSLENTSLQSTVVLKIDLFGNVLDNISYLGNQPSQMNSIIKLFDGNYLLTSSEQDGPYELMSLHCFNANLDTVWNKSYHEGPYWASLRAACPMQLTDSSLWILALKNINPSTASYQPVIFKFTKTGDMIWSKKYSDGAHSNNGFYMTKEIEGKLYTLMPFDFYTPTQAYIVVLDTSGQVLSKQGYTYNTLMHSSYFKIKNDSLLLPFNSYSTPHDFGFIVVDTSLAHTCSSDVVTFVIDTISPFPYYYNSGQTNSSITTMDPLENYTVFTETFSEIPFCSTVNIIDNINPVINIYPNPADQYVKIKFPEILSKGEIQIHDTYGRLMSAITFSNKDNLNIDVIDFAKGIYFITIGTDRFKETISFVKM